MPTAHSCHRRMDPLGFGLENFDAIGAWRDREGDLLIDTFGTLPGGVSFNGPAELKAVLKGRPEAFARCFTEKMLTYALGRGLDQRDGRAVDDIVGKLSRCDYRLSALISASFSASHSRGGAIRHETMLEDYSARSASRRGSEPCSAAA